VRTKYLGYGLASVLLAFAIAASMMLMATPTHSTGDVVISYPVWENAVEGQTFILHYRLEWNEPGSPGGYSLGIYWDCPENSPSENFTFLYAKA
jgi:hypothetical protein